MVRPQSTPDSRGVAGPAGYSDDDERCAAAGAISHAPHAGEKQPNEGLVTGTAGFIGFHLARRLLMATRRSASMTTPLQPRLAKQARHAVLRQAKRLFCCWSHAGRARSDPRWRPSRRTSSSTSPRRPGSATASSIPRPIGANPSARSTCSKRPAPPCPATCWLPRPRRLWRQSSRTPFAEADRTDFPVSLYAATKKAGEARATPTRTFTGAHHLHSLLHRLWPMGPARYGAVQIRLGHRGGRAD